MQFFKLSSILILTATTLIPFVSGAPRPDLGDEIKEVVKDGTNKINDIAEDFVNWIKGINLPDFNNININVPDDVQKFFNNVEQKLKDAPDDLWEKIKNNQTPQEIENWINSLPEKIRQEARDDLKKWADKYDESPAMSVKGNAKVVVYTAGGLAGALAVALAL